VLKQRNALLKSAGSARRSGSDLATLDAWDEHLVAAGSELVHARLALVAALRPHVAGCYAGIAGTDQQVELAYRSTVPPGLEAGEVAVPDRPALAASMLAELQRMRPRELERGISLVGPHRDDLELLLGGDPAKGYASHGESWSFALGLRLASFGLLRSDGVDPVLVLDDVFAELDVGRRGRLATLVADAEQVLITAAVDADVPGELGGVRLAVADGAVAPE